MIVGGKSFSTGGGDTEIEIEGVVKAETDAAFLVEYEGDEQWLPKSQIDWVEPDDDAVAMRERRMTFYVPRWLMVKKGWVES
jgi:hypothetical protein